ncbi:MAG: hypothetical protein LBD46_05290 [Endomicrobium sp.]|jgi:hypothetical protein|nr:hypothetical protein [Endomicrobium sp.]
MGIFKELEDFNESHKACIDSFVSRALAKEYEEKIKRTKQKLRDMIEKKENENVKDINFEEDNYDAGYAVACSDIKEEL